ncbi:aldehyde-activating protein [Vibrio alginolyticus]|uniref:GFA family protein n=1 Tax=Vibrio TaxID=662 RepID=UPI000C82C5B2|nr:MULTISPECIES: aldehyde-activating protein [Vibrio]MDE9380335.1 aldehyde-activating protein [Vibrio alginolyticus]MCG9563160.1 aldehyde-activating protein [Vibrio chagasii]MCG9566816.1 aldehyde-activating protein [Vibrio chagasii]MCG9604380.1 aldehyde-activating protein [Vibrio chagasii]MCG9671951.1 aldehyde-activating protein [Vibrio chagasii]
MELKCHCGNVSLVLDSLPEEVGECNCSICRRYAAAWAYFSPDQVQISMKEDTDFYCWGDKEVEFHRCNSCGCLTHYVTTEKCSEDILAVNMRMADIEMLSSIPVRKINGASY